MRKGLLFLFGLLLGFLGSAEPVKVYVGVYVLNLGKFELATGAYTVDFYLSLRSQEPVEMEDFEFMNGRAATVDKLIDTPTEKFYRIQANLSQNLDLRRYPFDEHLLTIEIEDKRRTVDELVYVVDEQNCGVDPGVIVVGWRLAGWEAKVLTHNYEIYGENLFSVRFRFAHSKGDPERGNKVVFAHRLHGFGGPSFPPFDTG
jgi:hypothetical protein